MFIPVAVGLVDSTGKDMPLTTIYSDGMLKTLSNDGQPIFTTVLQFNKVTSSLLSSCKRSS
jgi:aminopeptidase N